MTDTVFTPAEILLPGEETDLGRWAVLACDQHTSAPEYWRQAEALVGDAPSTLRLILPEVYLEDAGIEGRIGAIHRAMGQYLAGVLTRRVRGYVYVERETPSGVRQGLVGCVDLEAYDYHPGTTPRVRPTEGTVTDRIPPRLAVRRGAALESPHIMMLVDDEADAVIGPVAAGRAGLAPLYDTRLMLGGGRVCGWAVTDGAAIAKIAEALAALEDKARFRARYGAPAGAAPFAVAAGDGNHSLATAKAAWEELKPGLTPQQRQTHPARWCLAELVNLQSPAILIEPIHRVAFGPSGEELLRAVRDYCRENGVGLREEDVDGGEGIGEGAGDDQHLTLVYRGHSLPLALHGAHQPLAVGSADEILARCAQEHPGLRIDYVHGQAAVRDLADKGAVGLLMPPFDKQDLFRGVAKGGVLPRKTFSMGHAAEKRYYLECRAL